MLAGVYEAYKKDGTLYYRSNITHQGKHISLGSFTTEIDAHAAYQEANIILRDSRQSFAAALRRSSTLSFEKMVSLYNFRDNGYYTKTPIYLRSNYFSYYLSPTLELKFDVDDLFYFSRHKIMRRQGHYFVSDYGMQVSILSRYGIPPYAVPGKDYLFVNGDPTDFRHLNIELINPYQGVRREGSDHAPCFVTRLHIKGNWKIGTYETVEEAAVAYNKAIDLAKHAGIQKNYLENYVDSLSPRDYARIYTQVSISPRFLAYLSQL